MAMKKNLKLKLALAGLMLAVAGTAAADPRVRSGGVEYARVVDVTPIVRQVRIETPARECWQETEYQTIRRDDDYYRGGRVDSPVPTIAGGIIGGVIGRQFGSGSGRDAMTAVGALVGASIATHAARDDGYHRGSSYESRPVTVERCETRVSYHEEERIEGYRVTYVYAGREYMTTMASPPGNRIPVRVSVVPTGRR
jgi:uncharacterized protein YcfJ